jgi:prepilin-type N-terminal cleavage/methylation domain-containing protein
MRVTRLQRTAGFSFIEILVVMGIIAVLAGLGVVIIQIAVRRGPKDKTQTKVNAIKGSIDAWKLRFYEYPPSTLEGLAKVVGLPAVKRAERSGTNEANEALYQALYIDGFGSNPELGEDDVANLDGDKLQVKITSRGVDLREIVDAWGNPLIYFVNTEYAKYDQNPPSYDTKTGDTVEPRPYKDSGGGFVNPNGFQIFSMGEDGQPNTDDDILGWQ